MCWRCSTSGYLLIFANKFCSLFQGVPISLMGTVIWVAAVAGSHCTLTTKTKKTSKHGSLASPSASAAVVNNHLKFTELPRAVASFIVPTPGLVHAVWKLRVHRPAKTMVLSERTRAFVCLCVCVFVCLCVCVFV